VRIKTLLIWRLGVVGVITALGLLTAAPAYAAPPANDAIGGSVSIGVLPYSAMQDTSEATTDAVDMAANAACGAPATDASVWYSVTPTTDTALLVDVSGSSYSAGVLVLTGEAGSLELVSCGPGAVAFQPTAGITYYLLIIDDQLDGGGTGGELVLNVREVPPPPEIDLTVDPTARYNPQTGTATVSGTITCSGEVAYTYLEVSLLQQVGPGVVLGYGYTEAITCDSTVQQWSVEVIPSLGRKFIGGKAASLTFGFACGPGFFYCSDTYEEITVRISRR
jgi:hypothetical protein